jgi:hypothetical protein
MRTYVDPRLQELIESRIGQIIGSGIQFALNSKDAQKGSVSLNTYLVLVGLECLGLPLSLLISPPNKLIRSDGSKPVFDTRKKTFKGEMKAFWRICRRKEIALLIPIFITVQWGQTYQGNFLTKYFSVRSRALAALVISLAGIVIVMAAGWLLDLEVVRRSLRSKICWVFLASIFVVAWILNLIVEVDFNKGIPTIDYNTPNFGSGLGIYIFYR